MKRSRQSAWRIGAGLAIGGVALWLASRGTDSGALRAGLAAARTSWVVLAVASVFLTVAAGVIRWRILFHPQSHERSWQTLTAAFVVGQMLNIVLPLRIGQVVRAGWVSRVDRAV